MDKIDTLFIEATTLKKAHTRKHTIKVRSSIEIAHTNYRSAVVLHKANIKTLKRNIKSHKLLIKQARTNYQIIKLEDKK
jgi:hypothetical protein